MSVSVLSLLTAPAQAATASSSQGDATDGGEDSGFASLLDAAGGALGDGQSTGQQAAGGELARDVVPAILLAQEIDANGADAANGTVAAMGKTPLTGHDVAALKDALANRLASEQGASSDQPSRDDKDALKELSDHLDTLDAHAAELPTPDALIDALNTVNTQKDNAARSDLAGRILGFIQSALQKQAVAAPEVAVTTTVKTPIAAELANAGLFRPALEASPDAAQTSSQEDSDNTGDLGSVIPAPATTPVLPLWVQQIGQQQNVAAAPNASSDVTDEVHLPTVNLPKNGPQALTSSDGDATTADTVTGTVQSTEKSHVLDTLGAIDKAAKSDSADKALPTGAAEAAVNETSAVVSGDHGPAETNALVNTSPTIQTNSTAQSSATYSAHGTHTTPTHPLADQVQVAIKRASDDGIDRITIQLQPHELGRVEVNLHVTKEGATHVVFTADKAETLSMLQKDVRGLETTLQEVGIKADAGTMEFNLRQNPNPQPQSGGANGDGSQNQQRQPEVPLYESSAADSDILLPDASNIAAIENYNHAVSYGLDVKV